MRSLTAEVKDELRSMIYGFLAEEFEMDESELNDQTNIINDLDGDSLLFVELIQLVKKKYELNIQLQTVGKYLLKNPAETIGQVITTSYMIYERENDIVN